jgi:biotin transporter BioY
VKWVINMLVLLYLCGWLVSSAVAYAVADAVWQGRQPRPFARGSLAVVAGALWPVLVLGLVEFAAIAATAKAARSGGRRSNEPARCVSIWRTALPS